MTKKHILITGGNKGIGEAVIALFDTNKYKITSVSRTIPDKKNPLVDYISFDLKDISKIKSLINSLEPVDILINNSGIMNTCTFDAYPENEKMDLIKVNLEAPIELITCISKTMIAQKSGRIVNNASVAGHMGHPDVWYGATKAGLINATKSFARLLGQHNILVNAVAAGPVETDMMDQIPDARKEMMLKGTYNGKFAEAEDIAKIIFWLATDSPPHINGTCIDANNGSFPR